MLSLARDYGNKISYFYKRMKIVLLDMTNIILFRKFPYKCENSLSLETYHYVIRLLCFDLDQHLSVYCIQCLLT
jgi:hypothetical protein